MTQPPEDDLSPGRDSLVLAMAAHPTFVSITEISTRTMPVGWQTRFSEARQAYRDTHSATHLTKSNMLLMPDEWQGEMAKLITEFSIENTHAKAHT
jgi:hypothetical protein